MWIQKKQELKKKEAIKTDEGKEKLNIERV